MKSNRKEEKYFNGVIFNAFKQAKCLQATTIENILNFYNPEGLILFSK
jgi:hypothetical protein